MILAIDGEAGVGKTTVSSAVADRLGWPLLESGSLYRAIGLNALRTQTDLSDSDAVAELARTTEVAIECRSGGNIVTVDGQDVTSSLRDEGVGTAASVVAKLADIRAQLLPIQRSAARQGDLVAEGRDIGSVVFPEAELKFFLRASLDVRGKRRREQLKARGEDVPLEHIKEDMKRRDEQDALRELSPMCPAPDALVIDTSTEDAESVIEIILDQVRSRSVKS